jgi:hypothetical protein
MQYIDMTYTDPHSLIKNAVMEMVRGEDKIEAAKNAVIEMAQPFIGEDLLTQKIIDLSRNTTKEGRQIYNPESEIGDIVAKMYGHVAQALEPGSARSFRRIWKGIHGEQNQYGKVYDPVEEAVGLFSGHRVETVNVLQSWPFRMKELGKALSSSKYIYTKQAYSRGRVSKVELDAAYEKANKAYKKNLDKAKKDYQAAIGLGVDSTELLKVLARQRMTKPDRAYIMGTVDYVPLKRTAEIRRK